MRAKTPQLEKIRREKISATMKGVTPKNLVGGWNKGKSAPWTSERNKKNKGKTPWNKGKKGVQVNKFKGLKRPEITGENHPNWKGGDKLKKNINRHLHERNADGSHTQEEWEELKLRYGNKCAHCGTPSSIKPLTKDHVYPLSKGGTHFINNIQPLCKKCNSSKGAKII